MCVIKTIVKLAAFCVVGSIVFALGCGSNASRSSILSGYQPSAETDERAAILERRGDNLFSVRIARVPTVEVQKNPSWCWAAAGASLLRHEGMSLGSGTLDQDALIRRLAANRSDQSASADRIVKVLALDRLDDLSAAERRHSERESDSSGYWSVDRPDLPKASVLIPELSAGRPVLLAVDASEGSMGHVYVAIGAVYSQASLGLLSPSMLGGKKPFFVHEITVIDPLDGQTKVLTAEGDDSPLDRIETASSRATSVEYVKGLTDAYRNAKWQSNSGGSGKTIDAGKWLKDRF
jgi:hypothetical protein